MTKKVRYTLEYPVRCSPTILYEFLSTSNGLQEWFADKVEDRAGKFTFGWNGSSDEAEVVSSEENKAIRFHWLHAPKDEYFEFSIEKSEITNQTILVISDFADKKEIKDQSLLWEAQVKDLLHRIGN
ncbi:MAG TPA: START-like domain-containing protein [Chitinophagaceae bacterium]|nr:START-like domain-containing protein [Chitinophagaceae bacterium]